MINVANLAEAIISLLKDNRQLEIVPKLNQEIAARSDFKKDEDITITSSVPFSMPQTQRLQNLLQESFPGKKTKFVINSNLISGFTVRFKDQVYDFSLASKLDALRGSLLPNPL